MKREKDELIEMYTYIRIQMSNTKDGYIIRVLDNIMRVINEVEENQKQKEQEDFEKQYRTVKQDENELR
jgi:hypothetical protein